MAKPYSEDFRQRVIEAIELDGLRKSEASQLFNISRNTINLWLRHRAETGSLKPKPRKPSSSTSRIQNWEKFRAFVVEYGEKTQAQMAQLWEEPISQRTISRALRKMGLTRKKKLTAINKASVKNGQPF